MTFAEIGDHDPMRDAALDKRHAHIEVHGRAQEQTCEDGGGTYGMMQKPIPVPGKTIADQESEATGARTDLRGRVTEPEGKVARTGQRLARADHRETGRTGHG
jgi:hypothetical protein